MKRTATRSIVITAGVLIASWYGMLAVHELGHVLGTAVGGGRVERVVIPLVGFSRTDVSPNPHPLVEVWAGPIVGALAPPLLMLFISKRRHLSRLIVLFFAGFCLIANGAYLGVGSFTGAGDAGDLVTLGSPRWTLWMFGVAAVSLGLWMWHLASGRKSLSS